MDSITGVSLVASVATLIMFSIDTVQTVRKVYEQGSTGKYEDVEYKSERLASLARSLQQSMQGASTQPSTLASAERELIAIGRKCENCAQALQHEIGKLHARPHSSVLAAVRKTARSVWSRRKIEEISKQLETYRGTLETSLFYQLSKRFEVQVLLSNNNFASLGTGLQHVVKCLADSNTSLAKLTATGFDQIRVHTTSQIQGLEQRQQDQRLYDEILKSLFYPDIFSRQEQVDHEFDGIQNTYEWVFQQPGTQDGGPSMEGPNGTATPRWDDFPLWLKSGQGLYWINGKAGSGKSTLMNYICQHDLRLDLLKKWCVDRVLLRPAYFFWSAGSRQQKSTDGLLRSLIYQMLMGCPGLTACLQTGMLCTWTESRLLTTMLHILEQPQVPIAVCLFLDGLDEMEGQYESIVRIIRDLASHNNVKVCFSSRPLLVFDEAFSKAPGLRLQDLTFRSLQEYTKNRLSSLIQARLLHSEQDGSRAHDLLYTIIERADGVFLWAVIAIRDLREGLQGFADLDELAQAINSLPPQLDSLFMLMLHRIKPAYQRDAARFLQIALHVPLSKTPWDLWDYLPLDLWGLHFIYSHGDLEKTPFTSKRVPTSNVVKACSILQTQLLSHTAGLLELTSVRHDNTDRTNVDLPADEKQMIKTRVNFLHRTARDFLSQNDDAKSFLTRKGFTDAGVHLTIAKGTLTRFERFPGWDGSPVRFAINIAGAFRHIALAERLLGAPQSHLMRLLGDTSYLWACNRVTGRTSGSVGYALYDTEKGRLVIDVVAVAASTGMTFYVCEQLGISIASRDHSANLPNLSDYYTSRTTPATLMWSDSGLVEDPGAIQTMQAYPLSYRQVLKKRLSLDLASQADPHREESRWDPEGCCPEAHAGAKALPRWANEAFAETYLLACCTPGSYELVPTLLRAGANPMVGVVCRNNQQSRPSCFWVLWLYFLQYARLRYRKSFGKSGGIMLDEEWNKLQLTPEIVFDITRLQVLNGADINLLMNRVMSTTPGLLFKHIIRTTRIIPGRHFKRSLPADGRFDLEFECTAMFILEECFNDKLEFRRLAAAIEPRVRRPTRWPSGVDGKLFSINYDLLWPLLEKWEETGYDHDWEALKSAVEWVLSSQQSCTVGDEELKAAFEEMAEREREKTRTVQAEIFASASV